MNFLETADSGTLTFDGETLDLAWIRKKDAARLRRKTAFVFQSYNLFANKTALENVTEGLIVGRKMPKAEALALARKALDLSRRVRPAGGLRCGGGPGHRRQAGR